MINGPRQNPGFSPKANQLKISFKILLQLVFFRYFAGTNGIGNLLKRYLQSLRSSVQAGHIAEQMCVTVVNSLVHKKTYDLAPSI